MRRIIIIIFLFLCLKDFAQIQNISLKLSYSTASAYSIDPFFMDGQILLVNNNHRKPHVRIEADYFLNQNIEVGLYLGYSPITSNVLSTYTDNETNTEISYYAHGYDKTYFYGLNLNYHILPLLLKMEKSRFDLYAIAKAGMVSEQIYDLQTNTKSFNNPFPEFGVGIGAGYFFTKHIGIFGEYSLGQFYNKDKMQLRGGLVIKL